MIAVLYLRCSGATSAITLVNLQTCSPVEGAEATVLHPGQPSAEFVSGADGKITFSVVDGTRFTVKIQKAGFADPLDPAGLGLEYKAVTDSSRSIVIGLLATAAIEGHLSDNNGRPIRGFLVAATRRDQKRLTTETVGTIGMTDDQGRYRLFGLLPGSYSVAAIPQADDNAGIDHGLVYYPGKKNSSSGSFFDLNAGDIRTGTDFMMIEELPGSLASTLAEVPEGWKSDRFPSVARWHAPSTRYGYNPNGFQNRL